jgi:hypothetical protein
VADNFDSINTKLNQLMSQNIAQGAILRILCCTLAASSADWRDNIDELRMMTEWSIKNLEWVGSAVEAETIRSESLTYLLAELDEVHETLLRAEQNGPPPMEASSNPPAS